MSEKAAAQQGEAPATIVLPAQAVKRVLATVTIRKSKNYLPYAPTKLEKEEAEILRRHPWANSLSTATRNAIKRSNPVSPYEALYWFVKDVERKAEVAAEDPLAASPVVQV